MRTLIIDNFDSFTFNLYQIIGEAQRSLNVKNDGALCLKVVRNDEVNLDWIRNFNPTHIVISPGPGSPTDQEYFGVCDSVIKRFGPATPILGVCLGMQGIAHVFGAKVTRADYPVHGKTSTVTHVGDGLFAGIPQNFSAMRYHSLAVEWESFPDSMHVTATCFDGVRRVIMGIQHRKYPVAGIQFHPESFATEGATLLIDNFLRLRGDPELKTVC